ncbi:MAG: ATP-binding protein [Candidatus Latescibacterota bacterium]
MEDLSLHVLDLAENAIRAKAKKISIAIREETEKDRLTICICDDGRGMDGEMVARALDPFFTTKRGKKVGLGLALFAQAAQETGGDLQIESRPGGGTQVTAHFVLSHPDMKPVGSMSETLATLITGNPAIRFVFDQDEGGHRAHFDSHNCGQ